MVNKSMEAEFEKYIDDEPNDFLQVAYEAGPHEFMMFLQEQMDCDSDTIATGLVDKILSGVIEYEEPFDGIVFDFYGQLVETGYIPDIERIRLAFCLCEYLLEEINDNYYQSYDRIEYWFGSKSAFIQVAANAGFVLPHLDESWYLPGPTTWLSC